MPMKTFKLSTSGVHTFFGKQATLEFQLQKIYLPANKYLYFSYSVLKYIDLLWIEDFKVNQTTILSQTDM